MKLNEFELDQPILILLIVVSILMFAAGIGYTLGFGYFLGWGGGCLTGLFGLLFICKHGVID